MPIDPNYHANLSAACADLLRRGFIFERAAPVRNWPDFVKLAEGGYLKRRFSYRGQRRWEWPLQTSLERCAAENHIPLPDLYELGIEQGIIRRFKRQYHLHSNSSPDPLDHIEWLSLMQHFGAPTRLLDITYSAYVGLFFALESYVAGEVAALWCFNKEWLDTGWDQLAPRSYHREYRRDKEGRWLGLFDLVLKHTNPKVYVLNPYRMHDRLAPQQGGFILPTDITKPLFANFAALPADPVFGRKRSCSTLRILKVRLEFDPKQLRKVRQGLVSMNINSATLFPGLEGYSRNLRDKVLLPEQRWAYKKGF